jgi:hypothetical protein
MTIRWHDGSPSLGPTADVNFPLEPACPLCEEPGRWTRVGVFVEIDCPECGAFAVDGSRAWPRRLEGEELRMTRVELATARAIAGPGLRPVVTPPR